MHMMDKDVNDWVRMERLCLRVRNLSEKRQSHYSKSTISQFKRPKCLATGAN